MGKILLNGIEYSGLSIINGLFIDTANVITSGTITAGSSVSYTATADCAFDFLAYSSGGSNAFLQIDGKNIFTSSASTNRNTFLVKKGQTVTAGSYGTNGSYTVYGLKQGSSVSGALVNYSTTEQVIGKWIDGKPLYQITYSGLSLVCTNANQGYATNIAWGNIKKAVHSDIIDQYGQSCAGSVLYAGTPAKLAVSMQMSNRTVTDITIQYTKTTD